MRAGNKGIGIIWAVLLAVSLGACANFDGRPKQTLGTLLGGGLGALAGSQFGSGRGQLVAVAIGMLGGAFLGNQIGKSLDRADQVFMRQTSARALERNPTGIASAWRNPDTGHAGTVTPTRTFQTARGDPCREFQQTVTIGAGPRPRTAHRAGKPTVPGESSISWARQPVAMASGANRYCRMALSFHTS